MRGFPRGANRFMPDSTPLATPDVKLPGYERSLDSRRASGAPLRGPHFNLPAAAATGSAEAPTTSSFRLIDFDGTREGVAAGPDASRAVTLELAIELGRARMSTAELAALQPGAIVRLDVPTGEPVEVHVDGRLVARGEVVLCNGRFGVRITELVSS